MNFTSFIVKHLAGKHDQKKHGRLVGADLHNFHKAIGWLSTNFGNFEADDYLKNISKSRAALRKAYRDWIADPRNLAAGFGNYRFDEMINRYLRDVTEFGDIRDEFADINASIRAMDESIARSHAPDTFYVSRTLGLQLLPGNGGLYHDNGYQSSLFTDLDILKYKENYRQKLGVDYSGYDDLERRTMVIKINPDQQAAPIGLLDYTSDESTGDEYWMENLDEEVLLPRHAVLQLQPELRNGLIPSVFLGVRRPKPILSDVITPQLQDEIYKDYRLPDWSNTTHGQPHFESVRRVGLDLANKTGADGKVVELFAYLHDAARESDLDDVRHGNDAAALYRRYKTMGLVDLNPKQELQLIEALQTHSDTYGETHPDATVATCWDADKLLYGRVGKVDPSALSTLQARNNIDRAELISEDVPDTEYRIVDR